MSKLRELVAEMAKIMDPHADFLLVVRPKVADPRTGRKFSVIATNVGKPEMSDMMVEGTSTYVMDQVMRQRMHREN